MHSCIRIVKSESTNIYESQERTRKLCSPRAERLLNMHARLFQHLQSTRNSLLTATCLSLLYEDFRKLSRRGCLRLKPASGTERKCGSRSLVFVIFARLIFFRFILYCLFSLTVSTIYSRVFI